MTETIDKDYSERINDFLGYHYPRIGIFWSAKFVDVVPLTPFANSLFKGVPKDDRGLLLLKTFQQAHYKSLLDFKLTIPTTNIGFIVIVPEFY
jgi:hypothetical protein